MTHVELIAGETPDTLPLRTPDGWPTWLVVVAVGLAAIASYWVARGHHSLDQTVIEWEQRRMDREAQRLRRAWDEASRGATDSAEVWLRYERALRESKE